MAVPVAVNCVEEIHVVSKLLDPKVTVAPSAKCAPLIVKEKAPTGIDIGVTVLMTGVGFCSVTVLEPDLLLLLVSTAVTVMVLGVEGNSGALNNPVEEIVPIAAFPPLIPFTVQVSAGLEPSLVLAVNCWVVSP